MPGRSQSSLPVLILDDATSALDMETEKAIQGNLKQINGLTKIIIAHRISAVKNADEILILDDHKVAERGGMKSCSQRRDAIMKRGACSVTQDDTEEEKEVGAWQ